MASPPQGQDTTRPSLPGFWQFYRPKLSDLIRGWWWAANFHNDLVAAVLLTVPVVLTLAWWTDILTPIGEYSELIAPWLPRLSTAFLIALFVYGFLRVNYQRFVALSAVFERYLAEERENSEQQVVAAKDESRRLMQDALDQRHQQRYRAAATLAQFLANGQSLAVKVDRPTWEDEYRWWSSDVARALRADCGPAEEATFRTPPVPTHRPAGQRATDEGWRRIDRVLGQMEVLREVIKRLQQPH